MSDDCIENTQIVPDVRLLELVAACLCWAEFPVHEHRQDDPILYWQQVHPDAKRRYMRDAERIANVMMSDRYYAIVPVNPIDTMIDKAMNVGCGIRSPTGARRVWRVMIDGARVELRWRSGDI